MRVRKHIYLVIVKELDKKILLMPSEHFETVWYHVNIEERKSYQLIFQHILF